MGILDLLGIGGGGDKAAPSSGLVSLLLGGGSAPAEGGGPDSGAPAAPSARPTSLLGAVFGQGAQDYLDGRMNNPLFVQGLSGLLSSSPEEADMMAQRIAQGQRQKKADAEKAQNRTAAEQALIRMGVSPEDAKVYASNPEVAWGLVKEKAAKDLIPKDAVLVSDGEGGYRWLKQGENMPGTGPKPQYMSTQDGKIVAVTGGKATPIYEGGAKPNISVEEIFDETTGQRRKVLIDKSTGAISPIGGVSAEAKAGDKAPTEAQSKDNLFGARMAAADKIISRFENLGTSRIQRGTDTLPPGVGNFITTEEYQQLSQAERDFVNAVLRKESGAAISPAEFESARRQYFPQPGEGPKVIEQKRRARALAVQQVIAGAGKAYTGPQPDQQDGWTTIGGGVRIRVKPGS